MTTTTKLAPLTGDQISAMNVTQSEINHEILAAVHITPKQSDKYEVGAILTDSWGWEQTNIDFYCIVKRSGDFVTIMPMTKHTSKEIGFMTNDETPLSIKPLATPIRKKIKTFDGKESGFTLRNYSGGGWCSLWDGRKVNSTHYA